MRITEGMFITGSELHTKSRRGNSKKISAETMFVEEQMRNKLPMNKFRLAIRRMILIINTLMFRKQIFSRNNGEKKKPKWGFMELDKCLQGVR